MIPSISNQPISNQPISTQPALKQSTQCLALCLLIGLTVLRWTHFHRDHDRAQEWGGCCDCVHSVVIAAKHPGEGEPDAARTPDAAETLRLGTCVLNAHWPGHHDRCQVCECLRSPALVGAHDLAQRVAIVFRCDLRVSEIRRSMVDLRWPPLRGPPACRWQCSALNVA